MWRPIPFFPNLLPISDIFPEEPQKTYGYQLQSQHDDLSEIMLGLGMVYINGPLLPSVTSAEFWLIHAVWYGNQRAAAELAELYMTNDGMGQGRLNTPELRQLLTIMGQGCPHTLAVRGQICTALATRYPQRAANLPL